MTGLRTKIWFGFGGLLIILLIVSALSVVVLTSYSETIEQLYHENYDSVRYCDAMKQSLDALNTQALKVLWNGSTGFSPLSAPTGSAAAAAAASGAVSGAVSGAASAAASGAAPQDQQRRFFDNLSLELRNTTLPGEADRAHELLSEWKRYNQTWNSFESATANRDQIYKEEMLGGFARLKQLTQQISDMNMTNIMSVDGQVKRTLTEVRDAVLILVLGGTVISSAFIAGIGASIFRSVRSLTGSAREIERGNLDLVVEVNSRDELGQLAQAFNSMADKLREFRKSDHQRLLRAQLTTQLAIDSLPDAVCVISPQGEIEISNRTADHHFGIAPGINVTSLKLHWLTELWTRVLTDRHAFETEGYRDAIHLFENHQERFLLPRAVPMFSANGELLGITVILVDVTRLHHADELKSGLVSTVSHELRTPLTSIRMGVLMLSEEKLGPLTPRQRRSLNAVRDDSDRLHRIIENLLSIGRIEAGGDRFQTRLMTAAEIVSPAIESVRAAMAEKDIHLSIKMSHELPSVMADPSCIELALGNLLSNALKFTPAGGEVNVSVQSNGSALTFDVIDTGPGIPPEHAGRIFERFYRVTRKDGPTGAGLGLAISKEIVEAHGGQIWFKSDSTGSVFSFSIPLAYPSGLPEPAPAKAHAGNLGLNIQSAAAEPGMGVSS